LVTSGPCDDEHATASFTLYRAGKLTLSTLTVMTSPKRSTCRSWLHLNRRVLTSADKSGVDGVGVAAWLLADHNLIEPQPSPATNDQRHREIASFFLVHGSADSCEIRRGNSPGQSRLQGGDSVAAGWLLHCRCDSSLDRFARERGLNVGERQRPTMWREREARESEVGLPLSARKVSSSRFVIRAGAR